MNECMNVGMYACVHVCMQVCIHAYTRMHIHAYTYTCTLGKHVLDLGFSILCSSSRTLALGRGEA